MRPLLIAAALGALAGSAHAQYMVVQPTTPGHGIIWTPQGAYGVYGTGPVYRAVPPPQSYSTPMPPTCCQSFFQQPGPQPQWGR